MVRKLTLCITALLASAALAGAAPILDGIVPSVPNEYPVTVSDSYVFNGPESDKAYYNTGLDIDWVGFDFDSSFLYAGVATKAPFMPGGSAGSTFGQSAASIAFYTSMPDPQAAVPASPLWYLNLITDGLGNFRQAQLVQNPTVGDDIMMDLLHGVVITGGTPTIDSSITAKFGGKVGPAGNPDRGLEVWLDPTLFSAVNPLDAPYFILQLDDLGAWPDDQMVGMIPEPATMGLLAFGAIAVIRRRRAA